MDLSNEKCLLMTRYSRLLKRAREKGVSKENIKDIFLSRLDDVDDPRSNERFHNQVRNFEADRQRERISFIGLKSFRKYKFSGIFVVGVLCAAFVHYHGKSVKHIVGINTWHCFVDNNAVVAEITRPLLKCDVCSSLRSVPTEYLISRDAFRRKYAHTTVPVLIKNAAMCWSAMTNFSYQFFKTLYTQTDGALDAVEEECQFFHLNTDFKNLTEVFEMSDARAKFTEGEKTWYIGWSNCHKDVKAELRKHYERPYFLPNDSESSSIDWIFMGGSGPGALVHLDYVQRPSWQAQITGKKTWTLIPSPECESECKTLNVTVHKGDIFVVDTNVWYHSTFIHPGEISITIGSEYD